MKQNVLKIKSGVMKKVFSLLILGSFLFTNLSAQDVQQEQVKKESVPKKKKYTKATFQSSSIINMQSVEMVPKGNLQFMVAHHFGTVWNTGLSEGQNLAQVFGFNSGIAHTYLSFDYSPCNNANIGLAFAGNSVFEGWVKIRLLRQQTGAMNIPLSIDWFSLANANAQQNTGASNAGGWNKFSFMHQLLIARKFSKEFSLELMPTYIHRNLVPYGTNNNNNIFALGVGAKYQIADNKALTFEYSRQFNMYENVITETGAVVNYAPDLMAIGLEFNTGGHVFQFYIGNTTAASAIDQLTINSNKIKVGDYSGFWKNTSELFSSFALGFRLNRSFFVGKK